MSGGFGAQTPAIASTASAFDAQADPIVQQAERLESIKGSGSTTGRELVIKSVEKKEEREKHSKSEP